MSAVTDTLGGPMQTCMLRLTPAAASMPKGSEANDNRCDVAGLAHFSKQVSTNMRLDKLRHAYEHQSHQPAPQVPSESCGSRDHSVRPQSAGAGPCIPSRRSRVCAPRCRACKSASSGATACTAASGARTSRMLPASPANQGAARSRSSSPAGACPSSAADLDPDNTVGPRTLWPLNAHA